MANEFNNILFKGKQAKIIMALSDKNQRWYLATLAKRANATYVHTSKFIAKCQELGIVEAEVHGKIKTLRLTEKGQSIANNLISIASMLEIGNANLQNAPKLEHPEKQEK